jgi:hypothetical protein
MFRRKYLKNHNIGPWSLSQKWRQNTFVFMSTTRRTESPHPLKFLIGSFPPYLAPGLRSALPHASHVVETNFRIGFRLNRNFKMTENDDELDILPDTRIDRERTLTGKWALFVLVKFFCPT